MLENGKGISIIASKFLAICGQMLPFFTTAIASALPSILEICSMSIILKVPSSQRFSLVRRLQCKERSAGSFDAPEASLKGRASKSLC